ncbi:unnamed protein product [Linum trigynum]|uniref:RNase H type-1 domain-containing protein n=1 Tax=Linum trigynum TaxID=586398 RepID=A0AAV2EKF3_9ROSI
MAGLEHRRNSMRSLQPDLAWKNLFCATHISKTEIADTVFLFWRIWKGRCKATYALVLLQTRVLFRQLTSHIEEWRTAEGQKARQPTGAQRSAANPNNQIGSRRSHPDAICPNNGILVRFDGAMKKNQGGSIGFAGFSRDGTLSFAFGKYYEGISEAYISELLALRDAMRWCLTHNFLVVAFCGDAQLVIKHAMAKNASHSRAGAVLEEVHSFFSFFESVSCLFAPRSYNRAAHVVANQALSSGIRLLTDYRPFLEATCT